MPNDLLELQATPERLSALADAGVLSASARERALDLTLTSPPRDAWQTFLARALLSLGALLVLAGVIYFFAYNWAALHRFAKLGLISAAIAGTSLGAWKLGTRLPGQMALLASAVLVGPLLAVYGQIYQTGADPYELFIGWSVLILPWVALSRFAPLWLLLLALVNTGTVLFWEQRMDSYDHTFGWLALGLGLLNGLACATHEHFAHAGVSWLQGRWMPRLLAVMTVAAPLGAAVAFIIDTSHRGWNNGLSLLFVLACMAAAYALHRKLRGELFMLTVASVCAMTLVTTGAGYVLDKQWHTSDAVALFIMPLLIILELGLTVLWLRHEAQATGATEEG
ncbi:DUF2157 domain-containing protein [Corallococcus sp. H22C18031201]|uniref:DUF2157 domain-containing protein n=1 Tax=Citreicoccus inhibens TaxID=2849499 RepID=UPI000E7484C2|nr:DUF2157 domain-containing protein [Citreicoccus inhibens]MBU8899285.1 DUF2157 domain-containing protein [Citreicoccus inhibens]RJS25766.1 DUF2157 domain-containing protein [Corallococcus sp. H22C18031201]